MKRIFTKMIRSEDGVTAMEYGLIGSVVVTAIVISLLLMGPRLRTMFETIAGYFQ